MLNIGYNGAAAGARRFVNINNNQQAKYLTQLSSGLRINKASDDATSLAIGTRVKADAQALAQSAINGSVVQAVLATAEGGLNNIAAMLARMKEILIAAQAGYLGTSEFANLDKEYQKLFLEVTATATATKFNGVSLLDGAGAAGTFSNVSGANVVMGTVSTDLIAVTTSGAGAGNNATATGLALANTAVTTAAIAATNQGLVDTAINTNAGFIANLGSQASRVSFRAAQIDVSKENADGAASALLGADLADSQVKFVDYSTLTEAGIAALGKAAAMPQQLLRFLQS